MASGVPSSCAQVVLHVAQQDVIVTLVPTHHTILRLQPAVAIAGLRARDLRQPDELTAKLANGNLVVQLVLDAVGLEHTLARLGLVGDDLVVRLDLAVLLLLRHHRPLPARLPRSPAPLPVPASASPSPGPALALLSAPPALPSRRREQRPIGTSAGQTARRQTVVWNAFGLQKRCTVNRANRGYVLAAGRERHPGAESRS